MQLKKTVESRKKASKKKNVINVLIRIDLFLICRGGGGGVIFILFVHFVFLYLFLFIYLFFQFEMLSSSRMDDDGCRLAAFFGNTNDTCHITCSFLISALLSGYFWRRLLTADPDSIGNVKKTN